MSDLPILIDQRAGSSPLLISMPHAGVGLPAALKARMTEVARTLPDTDWHIEKLYDFAAELDASVVKANLSRYVIDLNRDPLGTSLYPGENVTELCPTTTFASEPVYVTGQMPDEAEIKERVYFYGQPYHALLRAEIKRIKDLHGFCILFDAHSIASQVPRFFDGKLPDLNWGTNDGTTCSPLITNLVDSHHDDTGSSFSAVTNGRFKGGYITRNYGSPQEGVHAIQLEIAQCAYMNENPPYAWDLLGAEPLKNYLLDLMGVLTKLKL